MDLINLEYVFRRALILNIIKTRHDIEQRIRLPLELSLVLLGFELHSLQLHVLEV